jgi:hypothetical protein
MSDENDPGSVVQRQLDAYNARDIERFLACFAGDARGFELGMAQPTMDGRDAIRARYAALFAASPQLHSRVVHRTAFGRAVIDHEHVTGRNGSPDVLEIAVVYEVEDGLIRRFHAIRGE